MVFVEDQPIAARRSGREVLQHARGDDVETEAADPQNVVAQQIGIGEHDDPPGA